MVPNQYKRLSKALLCSLSLLAAWNAFLPAVSSAPEPVRFGRDVLPILAANCFACHGPDEAHRKARLRLDVEADAKAARRNGAVIAPGQPDKSLLLARLTSTDPNAVMPPPTTHKQVTSAQIEIIRRWIAEGAAWGKHWSFEPVARPVIEGKQNAIDALVRAKLTEKKLALRPQAAPHALVRRLYLDLIGLPPTPEAADKFAAQPTSAVYEKLVDELLAKPQFGEHWARMWLDLARYADTKGYEKDLGRTIWPYRDWVVNALNRDMPLDQFTIEQLAGDLLPNPTEQQLVATAFHRNTMTNDEGGTDNEEFRVAAVKDRVDTTMQVWMGLTMGCAKCHTHKYDPITHGEYYGFYALFNQTEDADLYTDAPTLEMISPLDEVVRKQWQDRIDRLNQDLIALENMVAKMPVNSVWRDAAVKEAVSRDGATLTVQPDNTITASGKNTPDDSYKVTLTLSAGTHTALRLEVLPEKTANGEWAVGRDGNTMNAVLSEISAELLQGATAIPLRLTNPRADFAAADAPIANALDGNERTGWSLLPRTHEPHEAIFPFTETLYLSGEVTLRVTLLQQAGDNKTLRRFRFSTTRSDPYTLHLPQPPPEMRKLRDDIATAYKAQKSFNDNLVRLPLMRELPADKQRVTKIHLRGNFLEQGETVVPGVPAAFGKWPKGAPRNRLGVAQWLVNRDNPLTPRVWANRVWARLFGIGIVETEEDFGAQGALPSHPELLDWLAAEYRDNGWSLKQLIKTIVLSETYKQASETTTALRAADPRNLLLSRGARFRLGAEAVRDQALAVAGLLSLKQGGAPVMPPQPAGLWRTTYNTKSWIDAEGEDRYRRGLYTYLKRTTPYPSMTTFDGGSGEVCQVRRIRTNTPLQALVTLNDPVYLEAAGRLALRMVNEAATNETRAARGLRLALIRPLRAGETKPLLALQKDAEASFVVAPEKARQLLQAARVSTPSGVSGTALAAWVVAANAIMNLDEFLSRN